MTLSAHGELGDGVSCSVQTGRALAQAGLHPASGGDGSLLCSGDMLLEALVACAGVTLRAVATSLGIAVPVRTVRAEGDLDFRGTLGVDREAPVGFSAIRLSFDLDTDADEEQLALLQKLTERYCVVYQTLASAARADHRRSRSRESAGGRPWFDNRPRSRESRAGCCSRPQHRANVASRRFLNAAYGDGLLSADDACVPPRRAVQRARLIDARAALAGRSRRSAAPGDASVPNAASLARSPRLAALGAQWPGAARIRRSCWPWTGTERPTSC